MRPCLLAVCLACLPITALAQSRHSVKVINDTRSRIESFALAPAGSDHWTKVDFRGQDFDYELAEVINFSDDRCLYDFRTVLSDGRRILAHDFDACRFHAYRPGVRFYRGHPGEVMLP